MRPLLPILLLASLALGWKGVPRKGLPADTGAAGAKPDPDQLAPGEKLAVPRQGKDTVYIHRRIISIPLTARGLFLGKLDGVKCFNCIPHTTTVNITDSLHSAGWVLDMREEVWKLIPKPIKDRRMYDYDHKCVYFGYKAADTVFLDNEFVEIRLKDVPCFPYLQRTPRVQLTDLRDLPREAAPVTDSAGGKGSDSTGKAAP